MDKKIIQEPAEILTEEELNKLATKCGNMLNEGTFTLRQSKDIEDIIISHRELNNRNRKLVHENDELLAEVERLKWICKRSAAFVDAMVGFMGQNLEVFNWHQNGEGEPLDNFIEENLEENLIYDLKNALEELK